MLRKLYKHEFVSLYRILLPLYALLFGLSVVMRILSMVKTEGKIISFIRGTTVTLTVIMAIGLMFAGFVLVIVNFYKSLLGKQGYLTFSLPIKVRDHIICKLICGIVTSLTTVIAEIVAMLIILSDYDFLKNFLNGIKEGFKFLNDFYGTGKVTVGIIEIAVLLLFSLAANLLMFFAAMAIGQVFKNKVLGAIGMYFALYIAVQIIFSIVLTVSSPLFGNTDTTNAFSMLQSFFPFLMIEIVIQAVAYFLISNFFLSKKLNLE